MEIDSAARVQHLTKATSDELLSKFAEVGSESDKNNKPTNVKELRLSKRQKRSRTNPDAGGNCESPSNCGASLAERKSLLPPASRRSAALIRQLGIGRAKLRARNLRNKSIFGTIEKVS